MFPSTRHKVLILFSIVFLFSIIFISCDSPFGPYDEGSGNPPQYLNVEFYGNEVILTWQASVGSDETGYVVYRSEGDPLHYIEIADIDGWVEEYRDTDVETGKYYYYKVKTKYGSDPGKDSNQEGVHIAEYMIWATLPGGYEYGDIVIINPETNEAFDIFRLWKLNNGGGSSYILKNPYGIAYDGEYIWVSDLREYDETYLYRISTYSGSIRSVFGPEEFYGQLTSDGESLWTNAYGYKFSEIDPNTGGIINELNVARNSNNGLAWGDQSFWGFYEDDYDSEIYQFDPTDGSLLHALEVNSQGGDGICWEGEYLWYVVDNGYWSYGYRVLSQIDPVTGYEKSNAYFEEDDYDLLIRDLVIVPSKIGSND